MDPNDDNNLIDYLKKTINRINEDYKIIEWEPDGCDIDGIKYWVRCKNGYSSRSWNVSCEIREKITEIYETFSKNGFKFKGTTYYYDNDKLQKLIIKFI